MRALLLLALLAAPAAAQEPQPSARDRADQFSLDLPAAGPESTEPEVEAPSAPAPEDADVAAGAPARPAARFSADTPIEQLIANRRSKAVLDQAMPGLSSDKNLPKFSKLSLRQLAPLSGGRLTPELLETVDSDLSAIK